MSPTSRPIGALLTLAIAFSTADASHAEGPAKHAVATTPHFSFYNDFDTNLNDALLEAGRARDKGRPELFQAGTEKGCLEGLPPSARTAWDLAVDYYAKVISPVKWNDRQQYLIRVDLSGVMELKRERDQRFLGIVRGFRQAAAPAYEACRWTAQEAENRRWIEQLAAQLEVHEEDVSKRLAALYHKPLEGLPIRVDVVETVNWSGATTILLDPVGGHIVISNEAAAAGPVSLEYIFHEASHTLMGRTHPVRSALKDAAGRLEVPLPDDLWHAVLFYTTGDAVRRTLAETDEPAYTPLLFSDNIFGSFHPPMKSAWTAYLDGERTLAEAAADLLRAVDAAEEDH